MSSALHADRQAMRPGQSNSRDDVVGATTAKDHGWPAIDHRVENLSGAVVSLVPGKQNLTWQRPGEPASSRSDPGPPVNTS
jgi:hypothetical protein